MTSTSSKNTVLGGHW